MGRKPRLWQHGCMRFLLTLLLLALPVLALQAAAQSPMESIRANRWAEAEAAAARQADPVARKLVQFYRLLAPGMASADEIGRFIEQNPDWPLREQLQRRLEEAAASLADDRAVAALLAQPARTDLGRARRAEAFAATGNAGLAQAVREAWAANAVFPGGDADFADRFGRFLRPEDHAARLDRLAWSDTAAASAQAARLDPARRAVAEARLAFRRDDPNAEAMRAALPAAARGEAALSLEHARFLRRRGDDAGAAGVLIADAASHRTAPAERRPAFWAERNLLARRLLRAGDNATAYRVVAAHGQTDPIEVVEAEFLAGFIALRRLDDGAAAFRHFEALRDSSRAVVTQGRAQHWLARAAAARGDQAAARRFHEAAATYPTTFYGQLSLIALGRDPAEAIRAARDPQPDPQRMNEFAGRELTRAVAVLTQWGDPGRARTFLLRVVDVYADPADQTLAARLGANLVRPDFAVWVARRAGVRGVALPEAGWPIPFQPPAEFIEPAISLSVMRQESNFDPEAVSSANARGLMQLLPGTAAGVARQLGIRVTTAQLTADPALNMRLGSAYLRQVLDQAGGCLPCAFAAYNAGPGRLRQWLVENGDPRAGGGPDMVDWIELIPFNETRTYVQRVVENVLVYRARAGTAGPHPIVAPAL